MLYKVNGYNNVTNTITPEITSPANNSLCVWQKNIAQGSLNIYANIISVAWKLEASGCVFPANGVGINIFRWSV
jgi:hypothetical protein